MAATSWPDPLHKADPARVALLLEQFWRTLAQLPTLVGGEEHLLCADCTATLRRTVLELMLALNGIAYPAGTRQLTAYLSPSQRAAIERTLTVGTVDAAAWIGQAVALVVIYRWYAPQLVTAFALPYPAALEADTLAALQQALPGWPAAITTD